MLFWSIVAGLYPANTHSDLPSSYPYYNTVLKTANLDIPMKLNQIFKFENMNNISINVYALEMIDLNGKFSYTVVQLD